MTLLETGQPLRGSWTPGPQCQNRRVTITHPPSAIDPSWRQYLSYKESSATNFTRQGKNGALTRVSLTDRRTGASGFVSTRGAGLPGRALPTAIPVLDAITGGGGIRSASLTLRPSSA
jgi:hypothetical protein